MYDAFNAGDVGMAKLKSSTTGTDGCCCCCIGAALSDNCGTNEVVGFDLSDDYTKSIYTRTIFFQRWRKVKSIDL